MFNPISRADFLRLAATSASVLIIPELAQADDNEITRDMILNDPDTPIAGNPNGDLTIVDFFDYNCPYCKKAAKSLEKIVKADGNIRLVYKDWPILEETSIVGARLALAAKYQDQYLPVHHALMDIPGYGISREQMLDAVRKTGVDQSRLDADLAAHADDILRLVKRNLNIAEAIGLRGTPGFLVGAYKVNEALTYDGFVRVVADARARAKNNKQIAAAVRAGALFVQNGHDTRYRIHGTTQPDSIGKTVSSGCIRMMNQDVVDLYGRVPLGAKVVVL